MKYGELILKWEQFPLETADTNSSAGTDWNKLSKGKALGLLSAKDHISHPVFRRRTVLKGTHLVHAVTTQLNNINTDTKNFREIPR